MALGTSRHEDSQLPCCRLHISEGRTRSRTVCRETSVRFGKIADNYFHQVQVDFNVLCVSAVELES